MKFNLIKLLIIILTAAFISSCTTTENNQKYVILLGAVNRPGTYLITKKVPFILLLLQARGYAENADPTKVVIERDSKSAVLDLSIYKNKPAPHLAETFLIHPYDRIFVPEKKKQK